MMLAKLIKAAKIGLAGLFMSGLAACAVYDSLPYPTIRNIEKLGDEALSPDERDKAIQEMTAEQERHQGIITKKTLKKN